MIIDTYEQKKKLANDKTIIKTIVGSRLYGVNNEDSDYDYKGILVLPMRYYTGYHKFEQFEDTSVDSVIYDIKKALSLCCNNNPNMLEIIFAPKEFWVEHDEVWFKIYDNKNIFLSKKIKDSYVNYAHSQIVRMKNHKRWIDDKPSLPIKPDYKSGYTLHGKALLSIPKDLLIDGIQDDVKAYKKYSKDMADYKSYESHMKKRNPDRLKLELKVGYDSKHAMHTIRLLKQAKEIFETEVLNPCRKGIDADELISIRNCEWKYDDIIEYANDLKSDIEKLYESSQLPDEPDIHAIEKLNMQIIEIYNS